MAKSKKQLTYAQVGWAAGFFDGEGTVSATKGGGEGVMVCAVCNTHFPSIDRLRNWFGGRVYVTCGGGNQRPVKRWVISSRQAVRFALIIQPYTFLKAKQLALLLEFHLQKHQGKESWYLSTREVNRRQLIFKKLHDLNKRGV